jgi:2'-hydroxyisoflavone reductase
MSTNRRQFIRVTAAATGALGMGIAPSSLRADAPIVQPLGTGSPRKIRLLILGGTGFIGPHQVRYALARGHDVTIFNRGRTAPGSLKGVEELIGDRAVNNYNSLRGRTWDAVIDNSAESGATAPKWVAEATTALKDSVGQYLFISTRSVFADLSKVPATVDSPLLTTQNTPNWTQGQPYPYGLGKALAEAEARKVLGDRLTIVRPGLIVGPGDDTDRFTYWPVRIERGGEVLAPGNGEDRVQVIDVRDLCDWCVRLCEQKTFGTFMGIGPQNGRSMAEMLYGIAAVTTAPLTWTWVPAEFLAQHRIRPYAEMPVWRPLTQPGFEAFARFDLTREVAAGLTYRTLADTAHATLEFHHSRTAELQRLRAGINAEREAEVLRAWHASRAAARDGVPSAASFDAID